MPEVFIDALKDTAAMIPWLFVIYLVLELVERKFEYAIKASISKSSVAGPFLGALFGCLPQCGFSVIAAALFTQRVISPGTLLAVFLSTSDEAIPVILAQPGRAVLVLPILLTKIVIGIIAGYGVDFFLNRSPMEKSEAAHHDAETCDIPHRHCCARDHVCRESWWKALFLFPLTQTVRIAAFVFVVTFGINLVVAGMGEESFKRLFLENTIFQPVIAVAVGLIPNCAASVVIAEVFLRGGMTFGSAIAGLSAGAGIGLLVFIRENKNPKETFVILGLLIGISLAAGFILNLFPLFR